MWIGIDVGGTFTDGVLLENNRVRRWLKRPTRTERLQESIVGVLDGLLAEEREANVKRIVLSTTLITNLLATGRLDRAALVAIPGPGLNPFELQLTDNYYVLQGGIDFRGREIEKVDPQQVRRTGEEIYRRGIRKVAVVGKFCQRNPVQENQVASILKADFPNMDILMGHEVSGELNYARRLTTTYYTLITRDHWARFADEIEAVIKARHIKAPLEMMKADGGTMSMAQSRLAPCQTVFSGPAASTMGALALTYDNQTSVVVDIGGTTTDLSFILNGRPLHASKGAKIGERYTHVGALAVRSVALGGDSRVYRKDGQLLIGPERLGMAACFGGPAPTPTDAFNLISGGALGQGEESLRAIKSLGAGDEVEAQAVAAQVVGIFIDLLIENIQAMMRNWEQEPAYKVWEIVNRRRVKLDRVIGIGAASAAVIPLLAERLQCQGFVSSLSPVGNALGTVVARPTLQLSLHANTEAGVYSVEGTLKNLANPKSFQLRDARELAEQELQARVVARGMAEYFEEREFLREEQFNMVRGWSTTGRIFDIDIGIAPGLVKGFQGVRV